MWQAMDYSQRSLFDTTLGGSYQKMKSSITMSKKNPDIDASKDVKEILVLEKFLA